MKLENIGFYILSNERDLYKKILDLVHIHYNTNLIEIKKIIEGL